MALTGSMCARKLFKTFQIVQTRGLVSHCCNKTIKPRHDKYFASTFRFTPSTVSWKWTLKPFDPHGKIGYCLLVNSRPYSMKPDSGTSGDGLADGILKSKMAKQEQDQSTHKNDESKSGSETKGNKNSWFSGQHAWKLGILSLVGMGIVMSGNLLFIWGAPAIDPEDGTEIPDEFSTLPKWQAYLKRAMKEAKFFKKMIQEPSSKKLLPDPLKEPYYQPPYTLVLEMTGVLVHPDWTLNTGWRFKKRPGVNYFLQEVTSPLFEVVIYTKEQGLTAFPILEQLDPSGFIHFRLFRDATRYMDGHHVKDLGCLNRDLSKVIIVDWDTNACKLHLRNAVHMEKWKGDDADKTLYDLATFLKTISHSGVEDVREVLDYYNQFDNPLEAFKENQRKLMEEQDKAQKDVEQPKSLASGFSRGLVGRRR